TADMTYTDPRSGVITTYNNTFTADGTRVVNSFVATFDRPIDPTSFTKADVTVHYQDPNTGAVSSLFVQNVVPLNGDEVFGPDKVGGLNLLATVFLVTFDPTRLISGALR